MGDNQEFWDRVFVEGDATARRMRRFIRKVPSAPRCALCLVPFGGVGGRIFGLMGGAPSRKNPRFCNGCFETAPLGGAETKVGMLFADVRGYTSLAERVSSTQVAELLNRFYRVATNVLANNDAIIDKLSGDGLNAIFLPTFAGEAYLQKAVASAEALLHAVGYGSASEPWLPLGVGIDVGIAFVGNVGSGEVKDFTAIGDVVNVASRLQGQAAAGQIVMSERLYQEAGQGFPDAERVELELKGKSELVAARVVTIGS